MSESTKLELDLLEWDSNHFGIRVGKIKVTSQDTAAEVSQALRSRGFDCVIVRQKLEELDRINLLESVGFRLMDVRVDLALDLTDFHSQPFQSGATIRPFEPNDMARLMEIARSSFWSDHFHSDPRFNREKVDEMYSGWVKKCLREGYSVDVALLDSLPVGFLAAIPKDDEIYIELVAVDKLHRGKGVGRDLLTQRSALSKQHLIRASVAVQLSNLSALRAYENLGFRITGSYATLHWWSSA